MPQKQWTNPEEQQRNSRKEAMWQMEGGIVHIGGGVSQEGTTSSTMGGRGAWLGTIQIGEWQVTRGKGQVEVPGERDIQEEDVLVHYLALQ